MELILKALEIVAWPLVVIIIIILFRKPLICLMSSLNHFKFKEFEVDFRRELTEIESKIQILKMKETTTVSSDKTEQKELDNLHLIAGISPHAAIADVWRMVEKETFEAAKRLSISVSGDIAGEKTIQALILSKALSPEMANLYIRIRKLRNKVAHATEFEIDSDEAIRYIELAFHIIQNLKAVKHN